MTLICWVFIFPLPLVFTVVFPPLMALSLSPFSRFFFSSVSLSNFRSGWQFHAAGMGLYNFDRTRFLSSLWRLCCQMVFFLVRLYPQLPSKAIINFTSRVESYHSISVPVSVLLLANICATSCSLLFYCINSSTTFEGDYQFHQSSRIVLLYLCYSLSFFLLIYALSNALLSSSPFSSTTSKVDYRFHR